MDTQKLWHKISASKRYSEWKKWHDAFEQVAIINSWCNFEDYDVADLCHNDAGEVFALYCYLHFVLDVEFLIDAQSMAEDTDAEYDEQDMANAKLLIDELNKRR